jgi:hypothetical protein
MMSMSLTMLCVSIASTVGVASRRMQRYGDPVVTTCAVALLAGTWAIGRAVLTRQWPHWQGGSGSRRVRREILDRNRGFPRAYGRLQLPRRNAQIGQ